MSTSTSSSPKTATQTWVIDDFPQKTAVRYKSEVFSVPRISSTEPPPDGQPQFYLTIYPNGVEFPEAGWCSKSVFIYLWIFGVKVDRKKNDKQNIFLRYRISILDRDGSKFNTQEGRAHFHSANQCVSNWQYTISRSFLLDSANRLLPGNNLTLYCEVDMIDDDAPGLSNTPTTQPESKLSKDLGLILENGKHSDVVLAVGKRQIHAHKVILAARSKVFEAMFEHECKEKLQNRIKITGIQVDVFERMLRYIYTEQIDSLEQYAPELLAASDMYQIDCLKSACESYLANNIDIENASSILMLADLHDLTNLKMKCIDFIADHVSLVKATEGWKVLTSKAELVTELLVHLAQKTNR